MIATPIGGDLWRWDTGRAIALEHDCTWVDFRIFGIRDTLRIPPSGATVRVPNLALTRAGALDIYLVTIHTDGSQTIDHARLHVNDRPKPIDYVWREDDYLNWQVIRAEVQADTAAYAERAEAAAERAEHAAGQGITKETVKAWGFLDAEQDPTVPAWAKQPTKPSYTAAEVGALPADTPIPPAYDDTAVRGLIAGKQDKLVAGSNITISGNVISATGGGSGGSTVTVTPTTTSGKKVADIVVDGTTKTLYSPNYDGKYTKPSGGIPASDIAPGVIPTIPESIKNPNAITFTGAVNASYDGSQAVTVNIPQGGSGGDAFEWTGINLLARVSSTGSNALEVIDTGISFSRLTQCKEFALIYYNATNTAVNNVYFTFIQSNFQKAAIFRASGASAILLYRTKDGKLLTGAGASGGNPSLKSLIIPAERAFFDNFNTAGNLVNPVLRHIINIDDAYRGNNLLFYCPASATVVTAEIWEFT